MTLQSVSTLRDVQALPQAQSDWRTRIAAVLGNLQQSLQLGAQVAVKPVTFNAANFTGSSSMTWTVASGGQSVFWYAQLGKLVEVNFNILGTVGGTVSTSLQIALPGGLTCANESVQTVWIFNNSAWSVGAASVTGSLIVLQTTNAGTGNWTAGSAGAQGQIVFQSN